MPRHRLLLVLLGATFFAAGLIEPFTSRPGDLHSPLSFLHMAAIAVLLYMWCRADAAARNASPRNGSALLAAIFPPLGVPFYLFQSRPWRKALLGVGLAIALLMLFLVLGVVGSAIAEHARGA